MGSPIVMDEVEEFGPGDTGWEQAASSPAELLLLAPDHPFLGFGTWRAFAARRGDVVLARMVASIDARQHSANGPVGCIGFVDLGADGAGPDDGRMAAQRVLAAALDWLKGHGVGIVRGPVQFSTWYGHRAMTDSLPSDGGVPAFPLEPQNGRAVVDLLRASGFSPAHRAVSVAVRSDAVIGSAGRVLARLGRAGWSDRAFRMDAIEDELALLYRLSSEIFRDSWGFSEISFAEFSALYRPMAHLADAELVRFAIDGSGRPLGFVFSLPAHPEGANAPAFVVKSLGVLSDARKRFPGSGAALAAVIHRSAISRGLRDGIHATMAEGSGAHRTSLRWGTWIRSYATFERAIG